MNPLFSPEQLSRFEKKEIKQNVEKHIDRSFRESLISQFIEEINKGRVGTKYPPVNKRAIAIKINSNPFLRETWQLEAFLKQCRASKSFSACFYGSLKT